jgi:hypothetical protein
MALLRYTPNKLIACPEPDELCDELAAVLWPRGNQAGDRT